MIPLQNQPAGVGAHLSVQLHLVFQVVAWPSCWCPCALSSQSLFVVCTSSVNMRIFRPNAVFLNFLSSTDSVCCCCQAEH